MTKRDVWRDNGNKSRKMWFAVFSIFVMFAGMMYAAHKGDSQVLYGHFVEGVIAVAAMFIVGNVATKWVATKVPPDKTDPE